MTAVFATPVAAVLLAVELLLFEWRPRSMVPVALAACPAETVRAALVHAGLIRPSPLFAIAAHGALPLSVTARRGAHRVGVRRACVGDDAVCVRRGGPLRRLPLHWSWWPAIGGLVVGVGRADRSASARRRLRHDRRRARRTARAHHAAGAARRQARDLGRRPGVEHQRRDPRTAADARRRARRPARPRAPRRRRRAPGRCWGWRRDGRRDALPVHEHRLRARAHPRCQRSPPAAGRLRGRAPGERADAEALDPDREDRPPRLPRQPRIRNRPAARPPRPRRHEHRHPHGRSRHDRRALYDQLPEGGRERRQRLYPYSTATQTCSAWSRSPTCSTADRTSPAHRQRRSRDSRSSRSPTRRSARSPTRWSPPATACSRSPTAPRNPAWSGSSASSTS